MKLARQFLALTAVLATMSFAQPTLTAQDDPQAIFERCSHRIAEITRRCRERNFEIARECVRRINELLAAGQHEDAVALARRCIEQINMNTRACSERVRDVCEECIRVLLELEATELAARLRHRCEHALTAIRDSRARAIEFIRSAFRDSSTGSAG